MMEKRRSYAHGSWQVKPGFLLGFCWVRDVAESSSRIKKSQKAHQECWEVWARRSLSQKQRQYLYATVDVHVKHCKTVLWFEPQTAWQVSKRTRLDQILFDIRGLLSENKPSLWCLSQGVLQAEGSRGRPSTPAGGCRGRSGLLQSQLNQQAARWYRTWGWLTAAKAVLNVTSQKLRIKQWKHNPLWNRGRWREIRRSMVGLQAPFLTQNPFTWKQDGQGRYKMELGVLAAENPATWLNSWATPWSVLYAAVLH